MDSKAEVFADFSAWQRYPANGSSILQNFKTPGSIASRVNLPAEDVIGKLTWSQALDAIKTAATIMIPPVPPQVNAIPHTADVIDDATKGAGCTGVNVRICIASTQAPATASGQGTHRREG